MTTNCNLTSGLYCLPEANQTLVESGSYELLYNADFASLQGQSQVDVYLYNAENSSLVAKVTRQPNSGEFSFSVNSVHILYGNLGLLLLAMVQRWSVFDCSVYPVPMVRCRSRTDIQCCSVQRNLRTCLLRRT
jgi:hypothetical protein